MKKILAMLFIAAAFVSCDKEGNGDNDKTEIGTSYSGVMEMGVGNISASLENPNMTITVAEVSDNQVLISLPAIEPINYPSLIAVSGVATLTPDSDGDYDFRGTFESEDGVFTATFDGEFDGDKMDLDIIYTSIQGMPSFITLEGDFTGVKN